MDFEDTLEVELSGIDFEAILCKMDDWFGHIRVSPELFLIQFKSLHMKYMGILFMVESYFKDFTKKL